MRFSSILAFATSLAFAVAVAITQPRNEYQVASSRAIISERQTSSNSSISSFASTSNQSFIINGKTQYFTGTNTYWLTFLTNNSDVDLVMSHIADSGLKVLRVWGFNDVTSIPREGTVWFQSFIKGSDPVINTGSDGLQRLDYVVQSAEAHGVSLIINFVNNWSDYGGMAAYNAYFGTNWFGWYTSTTVQAQYQKYITTIVSRYKNSPAIFAWELANEPRCTLCLTSVITDWANTTSAFIKSLDPNHMVAIGDEGFGLRSTANWWDGFTYPYFTVLGLNFATNLALPFIDFGTYHLYPGTWGFSAPWGNNWITSHAAVSDSVGKPVLLEEYGSLTHSDEIQWLDTVLGSKSTAGDMFWQFGDVLLDGEKTADDGYTIYYGTEEYVSLVTDHSAAINAKSV